MATGDIKGVRENSSNKYDEILLADYFLTKNWVIVDKTSSYTLKITDNNSLIRFTQTTTNLVLTVPNNSSEAFSTGARVYITVDGTKGVTVSPATGVTIVTKDNNTFLKNTGCFGMLVKIATNTWKLIIINDLDVRIDVNGKLYFSNTNANASEDDIRVYLDSNSDLVRDKYDRFSEWVPLDIYIESNIKISDGAYSIDLVTLLSDLYPINSTDNDTDRGWYIEIIADFWMNHYFNDIGNNYTYHYTFTHHRSYDCSMIRSIVDNANYSNYMTASIIPKTCIGKWLLYDSVGTMYKKVDSAGDTPDSLMPITVYYDYSTDSNFLLVENNVNTAMVNLYDDITTGYIDFEADPDYDVHFKIHLKIREFSKSRSEEII